VCAPVLLGIGTWARTPLQLDQSTFFNYQGTSTYHFLVVVPIMGLPIGLVVGMGLSAALLVVSGLGVLGGLAVPLWTRSLGHVLHRQRHAMAAGFRDA
jgi:hypothetical protein